MLFNTQYFISHSILILVMNIKTQHSALSKAMKNKDLNNKSFNKVTFRLNSRHLQTKWIMLQVKI